MMLLRQLGELDNFLFMRYTALAPSKMVRSYLLYQFCKILDIDQLYLLE